MRISWDFSYILSASSFQNQLMNQKPFDYVSTINFPTTDTSTSQAAQSTQSGAIAQGFYFDDGGLQKPDQRAQPQVTANNDPMIGQPRHHTQDGFQESPSFMNMGGSFQQGFYNQNGARECTTTTTASPVKWESEGQQGVRGLDQHGMIMPDGMKMKISNQNARQYPHGSFQGSSSSSSQGFIRSR